MPAFTFRVDAFGCRFTTYIDQVVFDTFTVEEASDDFATASVSQRGAIQQKAGIVFDNLPSLQTDFLITDKWAYAIYHGRRNAVTLAESESPKVDKRGTGNIIDAISLSGYFHRFIEDFDEKIIDLYIFVLVYLGDDGGRIERIKAMVVALKFSTDFIFQRFGIFELDLIGSMKHAGYFVILFRLIASGQEKE